MACILSLVPMLILKLPDLNIAALVFAKPIFAELTHADLNLAVNNDIFAVVSAAHSNAA